MSIKTSIFSFFSGAGLMDIAFETTGFRTVFVNEFDKTFLESYQYVHRILKLPPPIYGYSSNSVEVYRHHRQKKNLGKMIEYERAKGNSIGFIGGPPCPDFSKGGKNHGANGSNGKLTKTYFDIICKNHPDFFVFENVKGLIMTKKHKKFYDEMLIKLKANGYVISDCLINALSYGVPQFRDRVFIIGFHRDYARTFLQFEIDENSNFKFPWAKYAIGELDELLKLPWPDSQQFQQYSIRKNKYKIIEELTVEYWFRKNDVYHHPNRNDTFKVKNGRKKIESIAEGDTSRKSFKRLHRWKYSPTAAYGNNEVHLHPYRARRISVAEAMAVQSLPKEFELPPNIPLSKKFKMIGNGVPYYMAKAVAQTLFDLLESQRKDDGS